MREILATVYPEDADTGGNDLWNKKTVDITRLIDIDDFVDNLLRVKGLVELTENGRLRFTWFYGLMADLGVRLASFDEFRRLAEETRGPRSDRNTAICLVSAYIDDKSTKTKIRKLVKERLTSK